MFETKAEPLRPDVPDAVLDLIDRAAALGIPGARKIILEAFEDLMKNIGVGQIAEAIAIGAAGPIYATTEPWDAFSAKLMTLFEIDGPLAATMAGATAGTINTLPIDPIGLDAVAIDAAAEAWLQRNGAKLITQVTNNTRDAINQLVKDAFSGPDTIKRSARKILRSKNFALNHRQAQSFEKFVAGLLDPTGPGADLSAAKIQQLIDRKYAKMLKQRAKLIAQTEAYNAGNAAQSQLWREAAASGDLDPEIYTQEWVTRMVNSCPRCIALDGATAEINGGVFTSQVIVGGGKWDGQIIVIAQPLVHPGGFCTRRIINREDALDLIAA